MKVRIMVATLVVAAAAVAAFGATAAKAADSLSVTLANISCNGVLRGEGWEHYGNPCSDPTEHQSQPAPLCIAGTTYNFADDLVERNWNAAAFVSYLNTTFGNVAAFGACAPQQAPANVFLCYSADQTQPGVWPQDVAAQLLKQGYWLPYAVSGSQTGGTNLGGFNLVCNIASTQSVSDSFVGGDGTQLGPQYAGDTIGLYPKVGG